MARREIPMNEVVEVLYQWHKGRKILQISQSLGMDRKTVRKHIGLVRSLGITRDGPLPDEQELVIKLKNTISLPVYDQPAFDLVAQHRSDIEEWLKDSNMTGKQIWRLLKETFHIAVGYTTIKRYLRKEFSMGRPKVTVRMETLPGEEAQVDFGYVGFMYDPDTEKMRKTWAFIMTLSCSRHKYVRFVFRQDVNTWLDCHERAFAFFKGVPKRVILDNLKSGVIKPDIYDPAINRAYADMERHYGFVADPARVKTPEHKGKVERAVPIVRKHLLAGRSFRDIGEANSRALIWCKDEIGMEIHGTTKVRPYEAFLSEEKGHLILLPDAPFEHPLWKKCTVHPDHHIVFDKSYYSLPTRYIGKEVWVKGMKKTVEIFLDHERIKCHPRASSSGQWITDQSDYPPEKLAFLMSTPTWCRKKAACFGPYTEQLVTAILKENAMRNLRKAQAILRLAEKHSREIEKVAQRALSFGNIRYKSIKIMIEEGIETESPAKRSAPLSDLGQRFLRPCASFGREAL
jgi:transposase